MCQRFENSVNNIVITFPWNVKILNLNLFCSGYFFYSSHFLYFFSYPFNYVFRWIKQFWIIFCQLWFVFFLAWLPCLFFIFYFVIMFFLLFIRVLIYSKYITHDTHYCIVSKCIILIRSRKSKVSLSVHYWLHIRLQDIGHMTYGTSFKLSYS